MLTEKEVNIIKKYGDSVHFNKGDVIIHEHKKGDFHCFFILKGELSIEKNFKSLLTINEQILIWTWWMKLGERNHSVRAKSEICCIKMDEEQFQRFESEQSEFVKRYSKDNEREELINKDYFLYLH